MVFVGEEGSDTREDSVKNFLDLFSTNIESTGCFQHNTVAFQVCLLCEQLYVAGHVLPLLVDQLAKCLVQGGTAIPYCIF